MANLMITFFKKNNKKKVEGGHVRCYYSALWLHSNKSVLSALVMYTFCTKNVQNGTAKLIFLTKNLSKILEFY